MESEFFVTCPYDSNHRILKHKLNNHIVKCKRNIVKLPNKITCPRNSNHIVDRDLLEKHMASCESFKTFKENQKWKNMAQMEDNRADWTKLSVEPYDLEENWSNDCLSTYDPMKNSAEREVIRCVVGLTKSEKKKFQEQERIRIENLKAMRTNKKPFLPSMQNAQSFLHIDAFKTENTECKKCAKLWDLDADCDCGNKFETMETVLPKYLNLTGTKLRHSEPHRSDAIIPAGNNSLRIDNRDESLMSAQNQETEEGVKVNVDFFASNTVEKKDEYVENARGTTVLHGRDINKLSSLLESDLNIIKIKSATNTRSTDNETDENLMRYKTLDMLIKRLTYLTDVQTAAAKESAYLLRQLKNYKIC